MNIFVRSATYLHGAIIASGLFECSNPNECPNSCAATWKRLTPSAPAKKRSIIDVARTRTRMIIYFSMSNIHHYQNVHHHHTGEKMRDLEHYPAHRMVLYHHDHQFQTIFECRFFDRDSSFLILLVSWIFDVQILNSMHYSITKGRK